MLPRAGVVRPLYLRSCHLKSPSNMPTVEIEYRDRAHKSVVVVGVKTVFDAYCSGCVVVKSKDVPGSANKTLVITSSKFVEG